MKLDTIKVLQESFNTTEAVAKELQNILNPLDIAKLIADNLQIAINTKVTVKPSLPVQAATPDLASFTSGKPGTQYEIPKPVQDVTLSSTPAKHVPTPGPAMPNKDERKEFARQTVLQYAALGPSTISEIMAAANLQGDELKRALHAAGIKLVDEGAVKRKKKDGLWAYYVKAPKEAAEAAPAAAQA